MLTDYLTVILYYDIISLNQLIKSSMKKIIIPTILLICIAFFFTSCGESAKASKNPDYPISGQQACHTELKSEPLATSVVAKEDVINTGQSVNGAVKDHAKHFPGYTKEMFLADNPAIAGRPSIKKLDPCDSTKVKYIGIPLYSGDVILLRLPYRIDTIPGYAESIIWKAANSSSHIKKILDIDDKGRVVVEHQNICCNGANVNPCPPQMGDGVLPPVNAIPPSDTVVLPTVGDGNGGHVGDDYSESETPWWVWLMLILLVIVIIMIARNKKADPNSVENITTAVREEGENTRKHVTATMNGLGDKMDAQTAATKEQTTASKETNQLLQQWLEQNTKK